MKRLKKLIVIIFIILFAKDLYSKNGADSSAITIEGTILDSSVVNHPDFESTITVYFSEYPFTYIDMNALPHRKFEIKHKAGSTFKIQLDDAPATCFMHISYSRPKAFIPTFNWIDNVYILQKGDSIFCKLNSDSYEFSGRAAKKLQCQTEVYKLKFATNKTILHLLQNEETYLKGLDLLSKKQDSVQWLQLAVIQSYKKDLGKDLTNALMANCIGLRYFGYLRQQRATKSKLNEYKKFVSSKVYKKIQAVNLKGISPSVLALAPAYSSFLFQRLRIDASMDGLGEINSLSGEPYLRKFMNLIQQNFTGSLRDKMKSLFAVNFSRGEPSALKIVKETIASIDDPLYHRAITSLLKVKEMGKSFYEFNLENTTGKMVKLSDFKDKIVILDFWYTGCTGCLKLHQAMQPIYQKLKDQPKVRFVTISIDKDKFKWRNSVKTGKYTNVESVNLYTNGLGSNHPVIKENLIYSYPQMCIIKDGKILSSAPPEPSSQSKIDEFLKIISDAVTSL